MFYRTSQAQTAPKAIPPTTLPTIPPIAALLSPDPVLAEAVDTAVADAGVEAAPPYPGKQIQQEEMS